MLLTRLGYRFISSSFATMSAPTKSAAKKEAKRLEKEAKLAAKAAKQPSTPPTNGEKKQRVDKDKKDTDDVFVNTTPKGEKKGLCPGISACRELSRVLFRPFCTDACRLQSYCSRVCVV